MQFVDAPWGWRWSPRILDMDAGHARWSRARASHRPPFGLSPPCCQFADELAQQGRLERRRAARQLSQTAPAARAQLIRAGRTGRGQRTGGVLKPLHRAKRIAAGVAFSKRRSSAGAGGSRVRRAGRCDRGHPGRRDLRPAHGRLQAALDALVTLAFDFPGQRHPRAVARQSSSAPSWRTCCAWRARAGWTRARCWAATPGLWAGRSSCPARGGGMRWTLMVTGGVT